MSQISCGRLGFPLRRCWLQAGADLSRPIHVDQCADRALMRSERSLKSKFNVFELAVQTSRSSHASAVPTSKVAASIKSP